MDKKAEKPGESGPQEDAARYAIADGAQLARNMIHVAEQSRDLVTGFMKRRSATAPKAPIDPLNISGAFLAVLKGMAANPAMVIEAQFKLWQEFMGLWDSTARKMLGGEAPGTIAPKAGDNRFRDKDWQENQIFSFIKQSYLLTADWMQETVGKIDGIDDQTRKRVAFFTKQFADAIAPTNFVLTNPEVLRATLASNGDNLVKGLSHLIEDMERGGGDGLAIRQSADAFELGKNIVTTPGKVVFRNELFELLQYSPSTEQVYERPLLIFPPWINKYYILDLQPKNSMVKWLVDQGYTVFVVSWVNPDKKLADKTFEDYMRGGIYAALDAVEQATGVKDPNCVGYCIGGTMLATTLAYMAAKGEKRVNAATFFTAQIDFTEAGDLNVFVDDEQLKVLDQEMAAAGGVLEGAKMATTFNMLRANDLIWSFVVNNYLMGKEPMPFDLLYWNSDATRMPRTLHMFYLRNMHRDNALARGNLVIDNVRIDLSKVTIPVYLQSSREDHIAPYRSVYKATQHFKGPTRFMLAGSGHIAGVINPPAANKYRYWTNDKLPASVDEWSASAVEHPGSWWPDWDQWLSKLSGPKVPARQPGDGKLPVLCDAPGTYVLVKAK